MTRAPVRPPIMPLTELDAREILRPVLLRLCSDHGPTRVGKAIGADEKTVRKARDEQSTLGLEKAVNLLLLSPAALDGFLARFGLRSAPIDATCSTDPAHARQTATALSRATAAINEALEDDGEVSDAELVEMEATLEAAYDKLAAKRERLRRFRLRSVA